MTCKNINSDYDIQNTTIWAGQDKIGLMARDGGCRNLIRPAPPRPIVIPNFHRVLNKFQIFGIKFP